MDNNDMGTSGPGARGDHRGRRLLECTLLYVANPRAHRQF